MVQQQRKNRPLCSNRTQDFPVHLIWPTWAANQLMARLWAYWLGWDIGGESTTVSPTGLCWKKRNESSSVVSNSLWPRGQSNLAALPNSPGKNTGVGSCSLLQGIFPTWGLNPGLQYCRQILYQLSHQGSPLLTHHLIKETLTSLSKVASPTLWMLCPLTPWLNLHVTYDVLQGFFSFNSLLIYHLLSLPESSFMKVEIPSLFLLL